MSGVTLRRLTQCRPGRRRWTEDRALPREAVLFSSLGDVLGESSRYFDLSSLEFSDILTNLGKVDSTSGHGNRMVLWQIVGHGLLGVQTSPPSFYRSVNMNLQGIQRVRFEQEAQNCTERLQSRPRLARRSCCRRWAMEGNVVESRGRMA
jgi:hypothetical protein